MEIQKYLNASRVELRKFGITFCVIFFLFGGFFYLRGSEQWLMFLAAGVLFLFLGYAIPPVLRPAYILWMILAFILAWINTRIILGVLFYLIFTPMGLIMRLFSKNLLEAKIDKDTQSYWIKRPPIVLDKNRYEQMF